MVKNLSIENEIPQEESASTGISRRAFFAGTATAGAAAVMGSLIGCSSGGPQQTSTTQDKEKETSSNVDNIDPLPTPDAWDEETDIVVVGTGGGGLAASLLSAQSKAGVVTFEKLPESEVGGNTKEASYFTCMGGSRFQNEHDIPFDPESLFKALWAGSSYSLDPSLLQAMVTRGYITIDWLEELGVPWDFEWTFSERSGTGLCWKGADDDGLTSRMVKKVTDFVYENAVKESVDFRFSTEIIGLVKEDNKITGVKAKGPDGEYYVKAEKGVILCAGGFEANREMLEKYIPQAAEGAGCSMTYPTNDGKVTRMGWGAGAEIAGFNTQESFDGGPDWNDFGGSWCQSLYAGYPALLRSPFLRINQEGDRVAYFDNNSPRGAALASYQSKIELSQPGGRTYVIFGKNWEENVIMFDQSGCRRAVTPDMKDVDRTPESICPHNWIDGAQKAIDNGWIKTAETINDLASQLELSPTVVEQAVNEWNEVCKAGNDNPFYGYKPEWLIPLEEGPYYAASIGAFFCVCGCGLAVNESMQVMGTDGLPIEGLYAGFDTAGGAFGRGGYHGVTPLGANHLSWWSGYVAAETALGLDPRA